MPAASEGLRYRIEGWEDGQPVQSEWRQEPDRWQTQAAERLIVRAGGGQEVVVHQQPKALHEARVGVGACVWDGALVLSAYLASQPPGTFVGKRCVELGAGPGLCGLLLARLGAQVVLTDRAPLLPLLRRNIAANWLGGVPRRGEEAAPRGQAGAQALDWASPGALAAAAALAAPPLDYVIATDCCYPNPSGDQPSPGAFVRVAAALCGAGTQVLTTFEARSDALRGEMSVAVGSAFSRVEGLGRGGLPAGFRTEHVEMYRWRL